MKKRQQLQQRQQQLQAQIVAHLDLLIGSVVRSPSMGGWCLTDKVGGKTVTRYVRKNLVAEAQRMSRNCQQVWKWLRQLSRVNWELLRDSSRDG
jgi:hypothetical protein